MSLVKSKGWVGVLTDRFRMAAALVAASCQGVSDKQFRELLSGLIR